MKAGDAMQGKDARETDIVCQFCGSAVSTLHGCQNANRILAVCDDCSADVAVISDWVFHTTRKEHRCGDECES